MVYKLLATIQIEAENDIDARNKAGIIIMEIDTIQQIDGKFFCTMSKKEVGKKSIEVSLIHD